MHGLPLLMAAVAGVFALERPSSTEQPPPFGTFPRTNGKPFAVPPGVPHIGKNGKLIPPPPNLLDKNGRSLLHYSFPSEADTLAYVDALKHSDLSQWRSLEEVCPEFYFIYC